MVACALGRLGAEVKQGRFMSFIEPIVPSQIGERNPTWCLLVRPFRVSKHKTAQSFASISKQAHGFARFRKPWRGRLFHSRQTR